MVLTNIRIFYVANGDSYEGTYETFKSPVGLDCGGASEDYGAGFLNLKAMTELDPAEAWVYPDWPEPAEHPEDVFAVGVPVAGGGAIPIVWVGTGFSQTASTRIIRCPANIAGTFGTTPLCASVQLTSTKNPTTGRWTHSLGEKQLRLGRLGPLENAQYQHVRVALSDVDPNVPGKVFCITTFGDPASFRLLRWRVLEHRATQTEWFGYLPNGTKQSLGTPDNGETVPTNNALVAVGASPCAEHIMDMRAALKKLMDDNWACVFYSSTYDPWVSGARGWRLAAWDFWGKYAGVIGSIGIVVSPIEGEFRCKPALYMALAQANHSATKPRQRYGLEVEWYYYFQGQRALIPTAKYWEFRKADADAMDDTPMHDIDVGEIRALVEMMEASYNTVAYPVQDEDDWIPDMPWRPMPE
jgi:hypothetical protein